MPEYPDYPPPPPGGTVDRIVGSFADYIPNILMALVVLIVGTVIAWIIAAVVRWIFSNTRLDDKLGSWIHGQGPRTTTVNSEKWISRIVFWLLMLFVLIAVFQTLDAPAISEPINELLSTILEFIPRLIGAALLLALAWIIAKGVKALITRGLGSLGIDERINRHLPDRSPAGTDATSTATGTRARGTNLAESLGSAAYWLVLLLFLPMILDVLGLEGILQPVTNMIQEILEFLPNLLMAVIILVVGWFVARVAKNIVAGLLAAAGVDRFSENAGLARVTTRYTLSQMLAWGVYILILIPVVITALEALQIDAITEPATAMLNDVLVAIPRIVAAAVLLVIAYVVARFISMIVAGLLGGLGLDRMLADLGLVRQARQRVEASAPPEARRHLMEMRTSPSMAIGKVVMIAIMLFAIVEALRLVGFDGLANLVLGFLIFLGNVVLGLIIIALGLALAQIAARTVRESGIQDADLMARIARVAVIVLAVAMGLRQMGIADSIINLAFGLTLGAIAVAAAIAFGMGGRDIAHRKLQQWVSRVERPDIITAGPEAMPGRTPMPPAEGTPPSDISPM